MSLCEALITSYEVAWVEWLRESRCRPHGSTLLCGMGCKCGHNCEIWYQVWWNTVARLKILRAGVGDPHSSLSVFADEDLQRQVDGTGGRGQHHGGAGPGVAEDQ